MIREILTFPDPRLKKAAGEVKNMDGGLATLVEDMVQTMYAAPGIGLAATQVGSQDRIVVLDVNREEKGKDLLKLVNPRITARELLAVCLQHELDHLSGKLFIDRISRLKRELYSRRVKKLIREGRPLERSKNPESAGI